MEKFSALLALCEGNPPVTVDSPHNGQWLRALMFSLNCAWTNSWTNNRDAGNLRRHRTDYDVAAMVFCGGDAVAKDLLKTFHYGRKPHLPTLRASIWFQLAHRPLWHLTFDWSSVRIIDRHWFYEMVSYRFDYDGIRLFFLHCNILKTLVWYRECCTRLYMYSTFQELYGRFALCCIVLWFGTTVLCISFRVASLALCIFGIHGPLLLAWMNLNTNIDK